MTRIRDYEAETITELVELIGKTAEFYCTPDMPMSALADVAAQEKRGGR